MSKREKRLEKLRQNPKDVSFEELRQVLEDHGFVLDHATGSHHIFRRQINGIDLRVNIPYARPVKSRYVNQALEAIDRARSADKTESKERNNDD
jgi:predicted RNA binding protein YcfA (HicA-like mRNA interferase family)